MKSTANNRFDPKTDTTSKRHHKKEEFAIELRSLSKKTVSPVASAHIRPGEPRSQAAARDLGAFSEAQASQAQASLEATLATNLELASEAAPANASTSSEKIETPAGQGSVVNRAREEVEEAPPKEGDSDKANEEGATDADGVGGNDGGTTTGPDMRRPWMSVDSGLAKHFQAMEALPVLVGVPDDEMYSLSITLHHKDIIDGDITTPLQGSNINWAGTNGIGMGSMPLTANPLSRSEWTETDRWIPEEFESNTEETRYTFSTPVVQVSQLNQLFPVDQFGDTIRCKPDETEPMEQRMRTENHVDDIFRSMVKWVGDFITIHSLSAQLELTPGRQNAKETTKAFLE